MVVGAGGDLPVQPVGEAPYFNPRVPDPCPNLRWPAMAFPTKDSVEPATGR